MKEVKKAFLQYLWHLWRKKKEEKTI